MTYTQTRYVKVKRKLRFPVKPYPPQNRVLHGAMLSSLEEVVHYVYTVFQLLPCYLCLTQLCKSVIL